MSEASESFFWLSLHTPYACRHSGACCSAGWPIPLETVRVGAIHRAFESGRLPTRSEWLHAVEGQPADVAGVLSTRDDGRCVFHSNPGCEIHAALGHPALPSACQHFPRECVIDPRGTFVTLSHFCPTAASLLFDHVGPVAIVEGPPVIASGEAEGLDARDALPPLLAPGILMDHTSYGAWEAHMIDVLAGVASESNGYSPEAAIAQLERDARGLVRWKPGRRALLDEILALSDRNASSWRDQEPDWDEEHRLIAIAKASLAPGRSWPDTPQSVAEKWHAFVVGSWHGHARVIKRLLAAHAFASWTAYEGQGLLTLTRRLHLALAVLRAEATRICVREDAALTRDRLLESIRQTDLLLLHLIDRRRLAHLLSRSPA